MKIRSTFVTNSSSSSFVVAYKSLPEIDEETLAKYPFLKNYGKLIEVVLFTENGYCESTSGVVSRTKEEYDENFIENYGWTRNTTLEEILEDDGWLAKMYNKAIEYLEKGYYILDKQVDYNDEYFENIIYELAKDKENFIILEAE